MKDRRVIEGQVLQALKQSSRGPLKTKQLARAVELPEQDYRDFRDLLSELEKAGKIYRVKGNRYAIPSSIDLSVGVMSLTQNGDGFVRRDGGGDDVFVRSNKLNTAMDGDRVAVRIEGRPKGRSPVGRVTKVLERAHGTVVGTLHEGRRFMYVVPLDRRIGRDILIPDGENAGGGDGDVVVVRMVSYGEGKAGPVGSVEEVLGPLSDPGVDVLAVAHGYGLALDFPPEVAKAAEEAAKRGLDEPGPHRVDRTDLLLFTIDPADAKDHDDALSVQAIQDDWHEVGIHIADVGHYVPEGGPVDLEALARGTSVYLVDRTIPMLPERLSGDVCSLRPDVDRLALSVFVTLNTDGEIIQRRYERTRIRSRHRLSYEDAEEILEGEGSVDPEVDEAVRTLDDLARKIRKHRLDRGALDFDLPEAKVILDDDGLPLDIQRRERLASHRLVEDFMILANEVVARDCEAKELPGLFRVHEPPTREKAEELEEFLGRFGLQLPGKRKIEPLDLQKLLEKVKGRPEHALVSGVVLRTLKRARYDPENLGHFGLGSDAYLHFTSPIRRYPDLVVHRAVVRTLVEGQPPEEWDPDDLRAVAERSSAREQAAAEAERDSVDMKKVEFMERHLGDEFDGRISGVTAFGFFVTLEDYFVDGLVHVNTLDDDFYHFREEQYALVGDRGGRTYRLGDRVRVQVTRVDKEARNVDFLLLRKLKS